MNERRHSESGMTLLELMFACGVLALALSMIFGSLVSLSIIGQISEERTCANSAVASILEEVRSVSSDELRGYVPPADLVMPGISQTVTVECVIPGATSADGTAGETAYVPLPLPTGSEQAFPSPMEIRVTLSWQERGGHVFQVMASTVRE